MNTHTKNLSSQQRWLFLVIISLGLFMIAVDNSILYTALPTLRQDLHTSDLEGLWIINAYPLVLAGLLLGTGTLGDKIGHRRMFEIGLCIFALASLLAAFSPNPTVFIFSRAILGAGAAIMMPATLALIRLTFTDIRERNTAIGVWGSIAAIGAAAGPVVGGFLLEHFWWGSVFLLNLPLVLIALGGTFFLAPPNQADPNRSWDLISSLWAMLSMVGFVLFIKEATHSPLQPVILVLSLVAALLGSFFFSRRQKKLSEPLLSFDIFSNRLFVTGVLGAGLAMFILGAAELLTTQRFQLAAGFSPLEAGLISAAVAIAAFPASILGGAYLHRIGFRPLISGGFLLITIGMAQAIWFIREEHFAFFLLGMIITGIGVGSLMSVTSTAIIGSAPQHRSGMASAIEEVSYEFGTLLSVAILGSLMSMFYARSAPEQVAQSMDEGVHNPTFAVAAAQAIDSAYISTMSIATLVAAVATVLTFVLLKGNPKETDYAHE